MNNWEPKGNRLFGLTEGEAIVHRDKSGKVRPNWLCACEQERNLTVGLMDKVADPLNLQRAYRRVKANAGKGGVDGMEVKELVKWMKDNFQSLQDQLLKGCYTPDLVRGVQIPKAQGGYRQLGIPTVRDRLVQQALHQVLSERYERIFSENSYGFRPQRSAHQALGQAGRYVADGHNYVIDLDLEKFFDEVNHHRLMWLLGKRIGDARILNLIHRFLQAGLLQDGLTSQRTKGTPQGGPLSPLLSNIILDELDKELERRGHRYVRYADDVKVFVRSGAAANRVKKSISKFIEGRLLLKVNGKKSRVCKGYELNFLGHSLLANGQLGLSTQSEQRVKQKVKEITNRRRGVSLSQILMELRNYLGGWLMYFKHAIMRKRLTALDRWIRRKIRCYRLKQCKRVIGVVRLLRSLGVDEPLCWRTALSGKSWWRLSNSPGSNMGMNTDWLSYNRYYSLSDNYKTLHRKIL